ncbi:hypothetical protein ACFLZM_00760 [Thermodesulfobacteriota bacterium]
MGGHDVQYTGIITLTGLKGCMILFNSIHRLTGNEIREVMFGRTRSGFQTFNFEVDITENGQAAFRGGTPPDVGKLWIDADMFCFQWNVFYDGKTCCCTVFRNPDGTPENKNEYLDQCDTGTFPWSPVN